MFAFIAAFALVASPTTVHIDTVDGGFELTLNPVVQPAAPAAPAIPIHVRRAVRVWGPVGTQCVNGRCTPTYGWRLIYQ